MKNILWVGLLLVVVLGIASFVSSPGNAPCRDCNVIIIGVDTLRADHVHALGYPLDTTPNIDSLAQSGYSFTNAYSASSWTVPSFMSIFTGLYPSVHKVVNKYVEYDAKDPSHQVFSNLSKLSPNAMTLAQVFKSAGYVTGGFTGDAGVGHAFGYAQGFDVYTDETTFGGFGNSKTRALSWLDTLPKGQKFFMFFHGYDLHGQFNLPKEEQLFVPKDYAGPYTGAPKEEAKLREDQLQPAGITLTPADVQFWTGLYDSKIHAADAEVGSMIAELKKRGLLEHTIVVVTADHGEEYYEHNGIDHGHTLYNELVHVPLIVVVPGKAGVSIPAHISTMDVGPALLKLLGVTPPSAYTAQTAGRPDLTQYFANPQKPGYAVFSETDYRDFTHKRSVTAPDGWKYILTLESGKEELYNTATDARETKNLITEESQKAEELRTVLRTHLVDELGTDPTAPLQKGCLPVYKGECE